MSTYNFKRPTVIPLNFAEATFRYYANDDEIPSKISENKLWTVLIEPPSLLQTSSSSTNHQQQQGKNRNQDNSNNIDDELLPNYQDEEEGHLELADFTQREKKVGESELWGYIQNSRREAFAAHQKQKNERIKSAIRAARAKSARQRVQQQQQQLFSSSNNKSESEESQQQQKVSDNNSTIKNNKEVSEPSSPVMTTDLVDIQDLVPDSGVSYVQFSSHFFIQPSTIAQQRNKNSNSNNNFRHPPQQQYQPGRRNDFSINATAMNTSKEEKSKQIHLETTKSILNLSSSSSSSSSIGSLKPYVTLLRTVFPWAVQQDIFLSCSSCCASNIATITMPDSSSSSSSLSEEIHTTLQKELSFPLCLPDYITHFLAGTFLVGFEAAVQQAQADHLNSLDFVNNSSNNNKINNSTNKNKKNNNNENFITVQEHERQQQQKKDEAAARSHIIDNLPILSDDELESMFLTTLKMSLLKNSTQQQYGEMSLANPVFTETQQHILNKASKFLKMMISIWRRIRGQSSSSSLTSDNINNNNNSTDEQSIEPKTATTPASSPPIVWIGLRRVEGTTRSYIDPTCILSMEKRARTIGLCQFLIKHLDQYVLQNPLQAIPVSSLSQLVSSSSLQQQHYGEDEVEQGTTTSSSPIFPTISYFPETAKFVSRWYCERYFTSNQNIIVEFESIQQIGEMLSHFLLGVKMGLVDTSTSSAANISRFSPNDGSSDDDDSDDDYSNNTKDRQQQELLIQEHLRCYLPQKLGQNILSCVLGSNSTGSLPHLASLSVLIRDKGIASYFVEIDKDLIVMANTSPKRQNPNPKVCLLLKNGAVAELISYRFCVFPQEEIMMILQKRQAKIAKRIQKSKTQGGEDSDGGVIDAEMKKLIEEEEDDEAKMNLLFTIIRKVQEFKKNNLSRSNNRSSRLPDTDDENDDNDGTNESKTGVLSTIDGERLPRHAVREEFETSLAKKLQEEIPNFIETIDFLTKHHPLYDTIVGCGIQRYLISLRTNLTRVVVKLIRVCGRRVEYNLLDAFSSSSFSFSANSGSSTKPRLLCRHLETKHALLHFSPTVEEFHFVSPYTRFTPNHYDPSSSSVLDAIRSRAEKFPDLSAAFIADDSTQCVLKHVIRCHPQFFTSAVAGCGISQIGLDRKGRFYVERVCGKSPAVFVDLTECYVKSSEAKRIREKILKEMKYQEDDNGNAPQEDDSKQEQANLNSAQGNSSDPLVLRPPMIPVGLNATLFLEKSALGTQLGMGFRTDRSSVVLDLVGGQRKKITSASTASSGRRRERE